MTAQQAQVYNLYHLVTCGHYMPYAFMAPQVHMIDAHNKQSYQQVYHTLQYYVACCTDFDVHTSTTLITTYFV